MGIATQEIGNVARALTSEHLYSSSFDILGRKTKLKTSIPSLPSNPLLSRSTQTPNDGRTASEDSGKRPQ